MQVLSEISKKFFMCLGVFFLVASYSYFPVSAETSPPPLMYMGLPIQDSTVNSDIIVSGWALNASGIKEVNVLVDGQKVGQATTGISRPEVGKTYPQYTASANSGFHYNLGIDTITSGDHIISVEAIGNDLSKTSRDARITVEKPSGIMYMGLPVQDSTANSDIVVSGWALNAVGIKEVNILVDGQKVGQAITGISRPEVGKAYPQYKGSANSGFYYNLSINAITSGAHVIRVEAIGNDSSKVYREAKITVEKPSGIMYMGLPVQDSTANSDIVVSGWALNAVGIKEVNILVDGQKVGQAITGISRPEVGKAYPQYKGSANSGFYYNLSINAITSGAHVIRVEAIGNDSSKVYREAKITVEKPSGIMYMGLPVQDSTANSDIVVSGWALNAAGVKEVNILVDGQKVGQAITGISRPEVGKAYPQYKGSSNSGFYYNINIDTITSGVHVIRAEAVGNDSSKVIKESRITVQKLNPIIYMGLPIQNSTVNSNIIVSGWSINASGIKEVNVLVDGQKIGQATIGISRPEVGKSYPQYQGASNSGYYYDLDINRVPPGVHVITVEAIGNDFNKVYREATITVEKPEPIIYLGLPKQNDVMNNDIIVSGWALNASGIKEVAILIDGQKIGQTSTGSRRPEVGRDYPQYPGAANSGYYYVIGFDAIVAGQHELTVIATGNDGSSIEKKVLFTRSNSFRSYTDYSSTFNQVLDIQTRVGAATDKTGSWTNASSEDIAYYMNPDNFMDNYGIYQFLNLNFTDGISAEDLNILLAGKGILSGKGQVFLDAAKANNISPIYLVSHALLETGNGTSPLANGILVSYTNKLLIVTDKDVNGNVIGRHVEVNPNPTAVVPMVSYNIFGIRAYDYSPEELNSPEVFASEYAYSQAWVTVDDAIRGGAKWIADGYINSSTYKQNTLYKMRWNPQTPGTHQYASDIGWAYKQINNIKKLIDQCPSAVLVFDIPRYKIDTVTKTIVLDAGHGGTDPGATRGSYYEKNLNMQITEKLASKLQAMGYTVLYTRQPSNDTFMDLDERANYANSVNADLFLSIHHNASTSTTPDGFSAHYSSYRPEVETQDAYVVYGGKKYPFIKEVTEKIDGKLRSTIYFNDNGTLRSTSIDNCTVYDSTPSEAAVKSGLLADKLVEYVTSLGLDKDGVDPSRDHNLYVTRKTTMPSVLLEVGYISNPTEIAKISQPSFQDSIAQKIAEAIKALF